MDSSQLPSSRIASAPQTSDTIVNETLDTDFRKEFPPDSLIGDEMHDTGRVWKVYHKEADGYDNGLLEGWSATLDILLIFAGLFSAVATAFVIESYKLLQPDSAAYTAAALYILVTASNHSSGIVLPPPPDLGFKSPVSRWINGLWFTSIFLSLAVALLSILVKQWITQYRARNRASARSPRDWARRRELYVQALESWPVKELVSILPLLLHISLFFFLAGAVAFLWTLDQVVGIVLVVLGVLLAIFYLGCTLIPLWIPECPTSTPLITAIRAWSLALLYMALRFCKHALALWHSVSRILVLRVRAFIRSAPVAESAIPLEEGMHPLPHAAHADPPVPGGMGDSPPPGSLGIPPGQDPAVVPGLGPVTGSQSSAQHASLHPSSTSPPPVSEGSANGSSPPGRLDRLIQHVSERRKDHGAIKHRLEQSRDNLDAAALRRLILDVSDSDAVAVGLQALGAVHPNDALAHLLRSFQELREFSADAAYTRSVTGRSPAEVLRVMRSRLCMAPAGTADTSIIEYKDFDYPDLAFYRDLVLNWVPHDPSVRHASTPSLTSTILLALRAVDLDRTERAKWFFWCDFTRFSQSDWDMVMDSLVSPHLTPLSKGYTIIDSLDHAALRSLHECFRPLGFAALLHCFASESLGQTALREILERVFGVSVEAPPLDTDNLIPGYENAESEAWLRPILLVLKKFCSLMPPEAELPTMAAQWLCQIAPTIMVADQSDRAKFWFILRRFCPDMTPSLYHACRHTLHAEWTSADGLALALREILEESDSPNQSTIWESLETEEITREYVMLGETLAMALCKRSGAAPEETAKNVDSFFATLPPAKDLLDGASFQRLSLRGGENDAPVVEFRNRVTHLVRHCIMLRSEWWPSSRPEEHEWAFDIYQDVTKLNRCDTCT